MLAANGSELQDFSITSLKAAGRHLKTIQILHIQALAFMHRPDFLGSTATAQFPCRLLTLACNSAPASACTSLEVWYAILRLSSSIVTLHEHRVILSTPPNRWPPFFSVGQGMVGRQARARPPELSPTTPSSQPHNYFNPNQAKFAVLCASPTWDVMHF